MDTINPSGITTAHTAAVDKGSTPALTPLSAVSFPTLSVVLVLLLLTSELSSASERSLAKYAFGSSALTLGVDQPENISPTTIDADDDVVPSSFIQPDAETLGWIDYQLTDTVILNDRASTNIRGPPTHA